MHSSSSDPVTDGFVSAADGPGRPSDQQLLMTLFDLGRQATSVLDFNELMQRIPQLISRLTEFAAFAMYLLDDRRQELYIEYAVGYPEEVVRTRRLAVGQGIVGTAVAEGHPILVGDVLTDARYVEIVPGTRSELVVPLRRKGKVLGALNLLSPQPDQFTELDEGMLRQFAAALAVSIENARLFEKERQNAEMMETLVEVSREVSSILDVDALLVRLAQLTKRLIEYRTFGILLTNPATGELETKLALKYNERTPPRTVKPGEGLVGYAAQHKEVVLVPDVRHDSRYVNAMDDVRSELVVPMLVKDRCIGVIDLESPELDAFTKRHVDVMTMLASDAAVAIENARLYEQIRSNEARLEREVRFAQRVQAALLPTELPKRIKGVDVAARFAPARELGGDLYDFLSPEANTLAVAVGDVSGKGVPAALYGAFAGELIRSRTFRRRFAPHSFGPAVVLSSANTILHERQLEGYYCTLCYSVFDLKQRTVVIANSGLPYPIRCTGEACGPVEIAGVPLGAFAGSHYDEVQFDLNRGDLFVFCSDGVFEASRAEDREFGTARVIELVQNSRDLTAREIVDRIFAAVESFRGDRPADDDMTALAVKITS
jgi:sigma-B regulation protein RsbU (phosphoserine phosphatase)